MNSKKILERGVQNYGWSKKYKTQENKHGQTFFMVNAILAQFEEYDRKIFWTFALLGIGAILLYAYFLSVSVIAVIARKEAEIELGRVTARVAMLESQYALLDRGIDLNFAHTHGFVDVAAPKYISTVAEGNVLTFREGQSGN